VPVEHLSSFETIHSGHAHVHEHEGDVVFQQVLEEREERQHNITVLRVPLDEKPVT
jgi:hypothetical protein